MARSITYVIPGNPIPLARPRIASSRNNKRMYDPQQNQRLVTGITLQQQHNNEPIFVGPIQLVCTFYMPIPQSISKPRQAKINQTPHIKKPDLSNMIKFVEDVASGILYHDDCIITSIIACKFYDYEPRTELTIKEA